jgi:HD-GYP domain-containing protein (c-di-GMP phosphodiesterase class II)/DNA-binding CsgD family transcriptional regulator
MPSPRAPLTVPHLAALDNGRIIGTAGGGQSVVDKPGSENRLRLAELLAAVSLATDLSHDVPAESALRDALLAVELARLGGWNAADVSDVYYLALLYHIGCTGAVAAQSRLGGGDDINVRRWLSEADYADRPELMRIVVTRLAGQWGPSGLAQGMAGLATASRDMPEALANIAEAAARLSQRLGASPRVAEALSHAYGRWDGKVFTSLPSAEGLSAPARLVHMVHVAQIHHQAGGVEVADAVVRQRSGTEFDPELARLWLQNSHDLLRTLSLDSVWDQVLSAEPDPHRRVGPSHLDEISGALADFVDLASPFTRGHSTRVARLAEDAALNAGLGADDAATVRRAAQVHDLGMVSVPNRVWMKRGPLNQSEWERVRLHPYHTQRILSLAAPLRASATIAGFHHERLDGSGYHVGLPANALPFTARLLAVAEIYQSMSEDRAWRPALKPEGMTRQLQDEVAARRLDPRAVESVLVAAGQPRLKGRSSQVWPAGLTDREVDVLKAITRGLANKQIARELHVSQATVHTHVINLYGKIGVNTRAGATLFAFEHDLIAPSPQ